MAITAKFIADVANWLVGLGKSKDAVEDNRDSLEDLMKQAIELGRQAGRTNDQIARDFTEAFGVPLDRAKRAVDEVTGATVDLGEAAADAGGEVESKIGEGTDRAGEALSELGSIAQDVLSGDFSGAAQGALSALGGIASAAGVGGAVGGAIITGLAAVAGSVFENWKASAEQTEQRISDMYDDMIESGNRYVSAQFVQKAIADITGDQDQYNEALATSRDLNVGVNDVILAMAGDQATLNRLIDEQAAKRREELDAIRSSSETLEQQQVKIDGVNAKYSEQNELINDLARSQDSAGRRFDAYQSANQAYLEGIINGAVSAKVSVDDLGNKLYELPTGQKIVIEADTGRATTDLSKFEGDLKSAGDTVVNPTVKLRVDTTAWDRWYPAPKTANLSVNMQNRPGQGAWSTRRFKEDIRDAEPAAFEHVLELQERIFRWRREIDPQQREEIGLIAEEVAELVPWLAVLDGQGRPSAVRYDLLGLALLPVVRELEQLAVKLRADVDQLGADIDELRGAA